MITVLNEIISAWKQAKAAVVFTGAGMSTESGLPDFRSKHGLWKTRPESLATLAALEKQPNDFYFFYQWRISQLLQAQPNSGHLTLTALEQNGHIEQIITQNVDGLHQRAGSKKVLELHGSLRTVRCVQCNTVLDSRYMLPRGDSWDSDYAVGRYRYGKECVCPTCGGLLRPEVVMFGESLPESTWKEAVAISQRADFFVVLGSSLVVTPANLCPVLALNHGAKLLIVNHDPTELDDQASWVIRDSIVKTLLAIAENFHS